MVSEQLKVKSHLKEFRHAEFTMSRVYRGDSASILLIEPWILKRVQDDQTRGEPEQS